MKRRFDPNATKKVSTKAIATVVILCRGDGDETPRVVFRPTI